MKKRILSLLLSFVMVVCLLPTTALAALPKVPNARIEGDYLKWDAVDGATKYCIFINYSPVTHVSATADRSFNLKDYCKDRYANKNLSVMIAAYDASGSKLTDFTSAGYYTNSTSTKQQLATPTNVQWGDGFNVTWDAVTHATGYTVILTRVYYTYGTGYDENYYRLTTTTNSINIRDYCVPDLNHYRVTITATAVGYLESEKAYSEHKYAEADLAGLTSRDIRNAAFDPATGILSWDAFSGAEKYKIEVYNIAPLNNYSRQTATGYVTQGTGNMRFDVAAFCYESGIPRTDGNFTPCHVLLSAINASGETISTIHEFDGYEYYYYPSQHIDPLVSSTVTYSGAARHGQTLTAQVNALPDGTTDAMLHYQWQYKSGSSWVSIGSATNAGYTVTADMIGKDIRAMVTVDGYVSAIYGAPVTVQKNWNMSIPTQPTLSYSSGTLTITNYAAEQEYAWTTTPSVDSTTGVAVWPDSSIVVKRNSSFLDNPTPGQTYYVYTRYKTTDTKEAGRIIRAAMYRVPNTEDSSTGGSATPVTIYARDMYYVGYDTKTPTIYLQKGTSTTIQYQLNPNNATANLPQWESQYEIIPNSGSTSPGNVTVTQNVGNKTITIQAPADAVGTADVIAYKNDGHTERWYYGGTADTNAGRQITVKIYDPNDLTTVPISYIHASLGEVNLYVGDTYTVDMAEIKDALDVPTGVNKNDYYYSVYAVSGDATFGSGGIRPVGTTAQDGSVKIDGTTIKAEQAGSATVYVFARTDNTVPTTAGDGRFAYFTVNVSARPALDNLSVTPDEVTLPEGDTYQLSAVATPSEAGTIAWRSENDSIVTVNSSTGLVTAVGEGTASVYATCRDTEVYSVVKVVAPCANGHSYYYVSVNESYHEAICSVCGHIEEELLPHDLYDVASTESGKVHLKCLKCDYISEAITIPSDESSGSGHHFRPTPSTAATESTTNSAQTGDAGIALYALLALSSYTGTALVVRGRKRK